MDFSFLVNQQRQWFGKGLTRPLSFRLESLQRLRAAIVEHQALLLAAVHADLRKSEHDALASEIAIVTSEIDFAIGHLKRWMKPRGQPAPWLAWPARAAVVAEPLGVSLIIGPWNYPIQLVLMPLVGALAAGCCAVIKPSELAVQSAAAVAAMVASAFEPHHVAVVQGDAQTAKGMLWQPFDFIFFTGSAAVGKQVLAGAAEHLTPVILELGGKCPAVVCEDADIELAARRIIWGKMLNAGQTCVAPDYVLVQRKKRDELLAGMRKAIGRFFGEDARQSPHFGRMINRKQFDRVAGYLSSGTVAFGGDSSADDLYISPTILIDVPEDAAIMEEEIVGPVLPIIEFDDLQQVLTRLETSASPLAAYIFSGDEQVQDQFVQRVRSGGICVNDCVVQLFGKHLPFGGVGGSGMGRYHGKGSFDAFSYRKTVLRSSTFLELPMRYPPVTLSIKRFEKVLRYVLRR